LPGDGNPSGLQGWTTLPLNAGRFIIAQTVVFPVKHVSAGSSDGTHL